jgi:hypothetical protein
MPNPAKDMLGQVFGYLIVTERAGSLPTQGSSALALWKARCVCGKDIIVKGQYLRSKKRGSLKSCGCKRRDMLLQAWNSHGMTGHPAWVCWQGMISRCENVSDRDWKNYGARGITVCESWRKSFRSFWEDMGPGYIPGTTLDRRDNDGPYTPDNCRWATWITQGNNKRTNVFIDTPKGRMTIADAARLFDMKYVTLYKRYKDGWSQRRMFGPVRKRCSSMTS